MTDINKHDRNDEPDLNPTSPNDRERKKTKDEENDPNAASMDVDFDNLSPRTLFTTESTNNNDVVTTTTNVADRPEPDPDINAALPQSNEQNATFKPAPPTTLTLYTTSAAPDNTPASHSDAIVIADEEFKDAAKNPFLSRLTYLDTPIWSLPIKAAEALWYVDPVWATEKPFTRQDLDSNQSEYDESLEFDVAIAMMYVANEEGTSSTVAQWIRTYAYAFSLDEDRDEGNDRDFKTIRLLAVRLALSDPVNLFPSSSWKNGELTNNEDMHIAWMASYVVFGAPWKNRVNWFETTAPPTRKSKRKSIGTPSSTSPKSVEFSLNTDTSHPYKNSSTTKKSTASTDIVPHDTTQSPFTPSPLSQSIVATSPTAFAAAGRSMYLSKELKTNPRLTARVANMKDFGRKFRTYVKLKFAKFSSDAQFEQAEELAANFKSLLDKIWTIDSSTILLAWKDGAVSKPIKFRSELPKTKEGLSVYVESLWMQKGRSAYCRALMAHDLPVLTLFHDHGLQSWLEEFDLAIAVERIQAKRICNVGHLLGYHATTANLENLAEAIQMQPVMQAISVEVRSEFVRFGSARTSQRTDTKILQIYTAWDSAARARRALVEIYSSRAGGAYPLGVQARFIPNVGDTRFIKTSASLLAYTNSLKKHIKFMNSIETSACHTIIEIDHFNPQVNMTLREAIMHIFSSKKPDCTLFVAVDTSYNGDHVQFAYRQELQREAAIMISGLPLFLDLHLGHRSVWNWFTSDAREATANFRWDMDLGLVPIKKDAHTNIKLHKWEHLDDDDEEFEDTDVILHPFCLLLDDVGTNAYNDNHTIVTENVIDLARDDNSEVLSVTDTATQDDTATAPLKSVDPTEVSTNPSTLTKTSDKDALLAEMASDPDMIAKFEALLLQRNHKAARSDSHAFETDNDGVK
jgi:hypothetical protein